MTGVASGWQFSLTPSGTGFSLTSNSNAVASPEFLVSPGPNTILTGVKSNQAVHFLGGTLEVASSTFLSNAVILDLTGGVFLADLNTNSTISGVISGPGTFTKFGPGILTLTGANTYTGNTYLLQGPLYVDGSLASPNVFIGKRRAARRHRDPLRQCLFNFLAQSALATRGEHLHEFLVITPRGLPLDCWPSASEERHWASTISLPWAAWRISVGRCN